MGGKFGFVVLGVLALVGGAVFAVLQIKKRLTNDYGDDFYDFDDFDPVTDEEFEHFFAEDNLDPLDSLNSFDSEPDSEETAQSEQNEMTQKISPAEDTDEQDDELTISEVILDEELLAASVANLANLAAEINSAATEEIQKSVNKSSKVNKTDEKIAPDFSIFEKFNK
jgi:hypothetical protein